MPNAPSFSSLNWKKRRVGNLKNENYNLNCLVYAFCLDETMQKWINFHCVSFVCFVHAISLPISCVFRVKSTFWTPRHGGPFYRLLVRHPWSTQTIRTIEISNRSLPNFATNQSRLYVIGKLAVRLIPKPLGVQNVGKKFVKILN